MLFQVIVGVHFLLLNRSKIGVDLQGLIIGYLPGEEVVGLEIFVCVISVDFFEVSPLNTAGNELVGDFEVRGP